MTTFTYSSTSLSDSTSPITLPREWSLIKDMSDASFRDIDQQKMLKIFTKGLSGIFGNQGAAVLTPEYESDWTLVIHLHVRLDESSLEKIISRLKSSYFELRDEKVDHESCDIFYEEPATSSANVQTLNEWKIFPIMSDQTGLGILMLDLKEELTDSPEKIAALDFLIQHFSTGLQAVQLTHDLLIKDPLTSCYNRWFMDVELAKKCELYHETEHTFSVMMLDIDHFKNINDLYGHREGDNCLIQLADLLRKNVSKGDRVIRMGGDEFLLLLGFQTEEDLTCFSEKLQKAVKSKIKIHSAPEQKLTLSLGAVIHDPSGEAIPFGTLIDRVDHALYTSKRKGRNLMTLWSLDVEADQTRWSDNETFPQHDVAELKERISSLEAELQKEQSELVNMLTMILGTKEIETSLHSIRVTRITKYLLQYIDLPENEKMDIVRGAQLHDIGKMAIPEAILHKEGKLTDSEWTIIKHHPLIGHNFVSNHPFLKKPGEIILHHHESYDGTGYPKGLKGEKIPLGARLFSLVDAYDSMRSNRVYQEFIPVTATVEELKNKSGIQFDPNLLDLFLQHIDEIEKIGCWQNG